MRRESSQLLYGRQGGRRLQKLNAFELLPADLTEKSAVLGDTEERFRLFYGMVKGILSAKEEEERARQTTRDPTVEEQT